MSHRYLGCAYLALGLAVGAPLDVAAQAPALGPQGPLSAKVTAPTRVAVAPGGRIHVVSSGGELFMLTPRGELMARVALPERAVAVAAGAGEVFVSTAGGKILRVGPSSARVTAIIDLKCSQGPTGLAFDEQKGLLWMAERGAGLVRALRLSGTTALALQTAGGAALRFPTDVAVDAARGLVWVLLESDEGKPLAHAYSTADGSWVRSAFPNGSAAGQLNRGGGIAVDGQGYVYGVDVFAGVVQVVSSGGAYAATAGAFGEAAGQLRLPTGAAVIANGDLVVANTSNSRLERFGSGAALPVCVGDSDCDGLPDDWELANGLNPNDPTDALADADFDGLTALEEMALGTAPTRRDTDGDGASDGDEVAAGTDPLAGQGAPALSAPSPAPQGPGLVRISSVVQGADGCTAAWTQVDGPAVTLRGAATFTPSFVARQAATYRLQGVATCGGVESAPVVVEAVVTNVAPRAEAGRIQVVRAGGRVELDGGLSSDANGDALALSWEQVLGPAAASAAAGSGAIAVQPAEPGVASFQLTAADAAGLASSAEAMVLALDGRGRAPAAAAASPVRARAGEPVALDARRSYTDGKGASFRWSQVAGPEVSLVNGGAATPSFTPVAPGRYAFDVRVVSRKGFASPPARVEVLVAAAGAELPRAVARVTGAAAVGEPVALDGSGSQGSALAYRWKQVSGPAAGLTEADQAVATAVPFAPGVYVFELAVTSEGAESAPSAVTFQVTPPGGALPVARAKASFVGARHGQKGDGVAGVVVLDGRGSRGAARWRWTQVAGPWVALDAPGGPAASFEPRVAGSYAFELEVDDGAVRSAPARVEVAVKQADLGGGGFDDDDGERD